MVYSNKFGPYFVDCYYCEKEVTQETHGWNASEWSFNKETGKETKGLWFVHEACLQNEENVILISGDWERGEKYSILHALPNPLAQTAYMAPCGCEFGLLKDKPDSQYHFAGLHNRCSEHKASFKIGGTPDKPNARTALSFYQFINETLEKQNLFQIDHSYTRISLDYWERIANAERRG